MADLRDVDLAGLEALTAVIEAGSFTKAADKLGMSQPAVSLAIKRLEERVGTQLLVRARRNVVASRPGEVLARGAALAFDALEDAIAIIEKEQKEPSGRVTIGCHESLASYALPLFMARLFEQYPKLDLGLWNGTSLQVEQEVIAGRLDLALVVNPSQHPDTVVVRLFTDSVELFHCFPGRSEDARVLLAERPLIYMPELIQTQDILRKLHRKRITVTRALPCSSLELVKNLILDRVGVGILPHRVAAHNTGTKVRSLSPPMPRHRDEIALLRRFDTPQTSAIRAVQGGLIAHGATLNKSSR